MNLIEIVILILILIIVLYFIYQHYLRIKKSENFVSNYQTKLSDENNLLVSSIDNLSNVFSTYNFQTEDALLNQMYTNSLNERKQSNDNISSSINQMLDNDISKISNDITFLNNQTTHMSIPQTNYNSIKSLQNGMNIAVVNVNPNLNKQSNKYLVKLNNGCLKATPSGSYSVQPCNPNEKQQIFSSTSIYDASYYNSILEKGLDTSLVSPTDAYPYPFLVMKADNNGNCLQNNHGSISIEPCGILKSQRWKGLNNPVNCIS